MAELITLLGTLSVLLTLIGTYRFTSFFFSGGSALAGVISLAVTVSFLMLFEQIIFLMGLVVILLPVWGVIYWREKLPIIGPTLTKRRSSTGSGSTGGSRSSGTNGTSGGSSTGSGGSNSNSGPPTGGSTGSGSSSVGGSGTTKTNSGKLVCPNCGTANDPSANFCENEQCLQRLNK